MTFHRLCFQKNHEISYAQAVVDYVATKQGELTVSKGDIFQVLACTGQMYHVCRRTNDESAIADGLVPSHVLVTRDITDNGIRFDTNCHYVVYSV